MTPEALYTLLGHQEVTQDIDVKTVVLDVMRERYTQAQFLDLFWQCLPELDEDFIRDYFYRKSY